MIGYLKFIEFMGFVKNAIIFGYWSWRRCELFINLDIFRQTKNGMDTNFHKLEYLRTSRWVEKSYNSDVSSSNPEIVIQLGLYILGRQSWPLL